jgi:hypothetical protein
MTMKKTPIRWLPAALLPSGAALAALVALVGCWETDVKGTAGSPCKADAGCRAGMVCKACGCMPDGVDCPTDANDEAAPTEAGDGGSDVATDGAAETTVDAADTADTTDSAAAVDAVDASDAGTDG